MKSFIFKLIDLICFIGGTFFVVGIIFSFKNQNGISWSSEQIIILDIAATLIVLGFLIRDWRKS